MHPILIMLVGVPASGKSSWREGHPSTIPEQGGTFTVISSDDIIEKLCAAEGLTYSEGFQKHFKEASRILTKQIDSLIQNRMNVIWDQTNLTRKSRAEKLRKFPSCYTKIAYFFDTPPLEEWERRLASRPGKQIPKRVLDDMVSVLEVPTLDEGFNYVFHKGGLND